MDQSATAQSLSLTNQYAYSTGKDGWTKFVKTSQIEVAGAPQTVAQELLSGILYGEGIKIPNHKTLEEVRALNPGVSNDQAQAILICNTKVIEAKLEKHPAALMQAHVTLISGMGKDAMDKLNQDSEFRINSEQRRPDPMVTWNTMGRIFYDERGGKGNMAKVLMLKEEKVKFLAMTQLPNETVTEYNLRRLRMRTVVETQGIKVIPSLFASEEEETISFIFSLLAGPYAEWHTALKRGESNSGNSAAVRVPKTIQEAIEEDDKWRTENTQHTAAIKSVFVTDTQMPPNTPALVFGKPALPMPQVYPKIKRADWSAGTKEERTAVYLHNEALRDAVNQQQGWRAERIPTEEAKIGEKSKNTKGRSKQSTMITTKEPDTVQEETYTLGLLTYVVPTPKVETDAAECRPPPTECHFSTGTPKGTDRGATQGSHPVQNVCKRKDESRWHH